MVVRINGVKFVKKKIIFFVNDMFKFLKFICIFILIFLSIIRVKKIVRCI